MLKITRRQCLQQGAAALAGLAVSRGFAQETSSLPPVRTITQGPRHHWFGYYDKLQCDATGQKILAMEVDFEHRSPRPDDKIRVGMIDLDDSGRWTELGTSLAWCWQQGCMLQWVPGKGRRVIWNDREEDQFVSRILDLDTGQRRTLPAPIYTLHPDGRSAILPDFGRLADLRPGYGYAGVPDPYADDLVPKASGVWRLDLETGKKELIVSLAQVASLGRRLPSMKDAKHWFNHLLFNTDGSRIEFLHRWKGAHGRQTHMLTAKPDGSDVRVIDDNGLTSHFIWRDEQHILAFSNPHGIGNGFYLFEDGGEGKIEQVGKNVMTEDGHCTYSPDKKWILNDTYPNKERLQTPYLYHVESGRVFPLGHFRLPEVYNGEWRCDTHPRFTPDGRGVLIDSPHTGTGRQIHLIDVSEIVG